MFVLVSSNLLYFYRLRVLDKVEYSAVESMLNSTIVSYRIETTGYFSCLDHRPIADNVYSVHVPSVCDVPVLFTDDESALRVFNSG